MRNWLALSLGAVLAISVLSGCDDHHDRKAQDRTVHHGASVAGRLGMGWRTTADGKMSVWRFQGNSRPAEADAIDAIRAALAANMLPPRDSVRIAELIGDAIAATPARTDAAAKEQAVVTTTPWNDHTWLLWVAVSGLQAGDHPGLTVEFDPKVVAAFRPLGDVSALPDLDTDAGHAEMLYELSPQAGAALPRTVTYAVLHVSRVAAAGAAPLESDRAITSADFVDSIDNAPDAVRFATAVAGFGSLLRGDPAVRDLSCADVIALAESAGQPDPDGTRAQMIDLMRKAEPLIDQPAATPQAADDQAR